MHPPACFAEVGHGDADIEAMACRLGSDGPSTSMNPPFPRFDAALNAALQRIKLAARQAAQRSVDSLGLAALASLSARERDALLAAQFELARKLVNFSHAFEETLDRHVARTLRPEAAKVSSPAMTDWESLSLVDDNEVEAQVRADRFGLAIQHECEWELRELDAYVASLLQLQCLNPERNPLRPEAVGLALIAGADAVSERPEVRKVLAAELGRTLISLMRGTYGEILDDLRRAGVQPLSLALRTSGRRGSDSLGASTGYGLSSDGRSTTVDTPMGPIGNAPGAGPGRTRSGSGNGWGSSSFSGSGATRTGSPAGTMGAVDAQLVSLIRRLAV
ncbi:MAG TPA: DUF1631 family protein, partial [Burkholderiaceae bacterium]|nr:DUF1631 family protein [Burkholderiaceae bacterium]